MLVLSHDQQRVVDRAVKFFSENQSGVFAIFGAAGTGKTTVVSEVISKLNLRTAVVAYTNKVKRVIYEKTKHSGSVTPFTLHSLFGLAITDDGEIKRDPTKNEQHQTYQLIVIDECSMIQNDLVDYIYATLYHKRVIFLGDPCQLPPVRQDHESSAFEVENCEHLREIMRFDPSSNLAVNAKRMRDAIYTENPGPVVKARFDTGGNVLPYNDYNVWFGKIIEEFSSPEYAANLDHCRVLAINNSVVRELNAKIREALHGPSKDWAFYKGEHLVVQKPLMYLSKDGSGRTIIGADNSEIITVISAPTELEVVTYRPFEKKPLHDTFDFQLPVWPVEVQTESGDILPIRVLSQGSQQQFLLAIDKLRGYIRQQGDRSLWPLFFAFRDTAVHEVEYVYAQTLHKSQGSTYTKVFLHEQNIEERRNQVFGNLTLWKAKYVAVTRAAKELHSYNPDYVGAPA